MAPPAPPSAGVGRLILCVPGMIWLLLLSVLNAPAVDAGSVTACPAGRYGPDVRLTRGSCGAAGRIATKEQCEAAASRTGITSATTATIWQCDSCVSGCHFYYGSLQFNTRNTSVACSSNDQCLCGNVCFACPAGTYAETAGVRSSCTGKPCVPGTYGRDGASSATDASCRYPSSSTSLDAALAYNCSTGEYVHCSRSTSAKKVQASPGRLRDGWSEQSGSGAGACDCVACNVPRWCLAGAMCADGRAGLGCSRCATDHVPLGAFCFRCPTQKWLTFVPLLVLVALGGYLLFKLHAGTEAAIVRALAHANSSNQHRRGSSNIVNSQERVAQSGAASRSAAEGLSLLRQAAALLTIVSVLQVFAGSTRLGVPWPASVQFACDIIGRISIFDMVDSGLPTCFGANISYQDRWLLTIILPLAPIACSRVLACCKRCWEFYDPNRSAVTAGEGLPSRFLRSMHHASIGLFLLLFTLLVQASVAPFDCVRAAQQTHVMRRDPAVQCNWDGTAGMTTDLSLWNALVLCGAIALACCVFAIICIVHIMWRARRVGTLRNERFLRVYGALFLRYNDNQCYWEAVILTRKLLLEMFLALLPSQPWAQLVLCALLFFICFWLQTRYRPFVSDALNSIEHDALCACIVVIVLAMAALSGASATVVEVLFFTTLLFTLLSIARQIRRVWRGEDEWQQQYEEGRVRARTRTATMSVLYSEHVQAMQRMRANRWQSVSAPNSEPSTRGWHAETDTKTGREYFTAECATQAAKLPAGWRTATDPDTGREYYTNELGECTWEVPTTSALDVENPTIQSAMPAQETLRAGIRHERSHTEVL